MNKIVLSGIVLLLLFPFLESQAQEEPFSLFEIVEMAREESPAALQVETRRENRYWQYRTYLSDYKPQLVINGLEEYNNGIIPTIQPDGSYDFTKVHQNFGRVELSLEQQIGITGSKIFLTSQLTRFDNFAENFKRYSGNPAFIGIEQPLFRFNSLRWNRRIEPLRYEESQREYVEELEQIAVNATSLFFDLLLAQASLEIAQKNLANNDTIYKIAEGRYNLGKVSEGELLQLELALMRAQQQVAEAKLDLETTGLRLKSYVGLNNNDQLLLIPPVLIPEFEVDVDVALQEANDNRQDAIGFKRQELEAERDLARAKNDSGLDASLRATFGLTNQGLEFTDVYHSPGDQQGVLLEFSIPVVDWGRQRSRVKTAEANMKLIDYTIAQEKINFEQEIYTQVKLFKMLRIQTEIAEKSDDIAQRRYELSKNRYLIGKISITDLNIATQEKDEARRSYIAALREFWIAYYRLRELTLYDFQQEVPIIEG
ncbi:TolC family protein [Nafulsella turpanensis]|uniref:TolC family protein n=1 Tax=Nafulsella turpanensis TaxID=1265690 RepID=UPI0003449274|nr:TolC family protein [Nafulsella turpanensis]